MEKNLILYPMAAYVFYTYGLGLFLFITRFNAVKNNKVSLKYFEAYNITPPPDKAVVLGRHYDHQFQVPVLFYIASALHFVVGQVNIWTLAFAWFFVATRLIHTYIHLGKNVISQRFIIFAWGWLAVVALWVQLLVFVN